MTTLLESLLSQAAHIGANTRAEIEAAKASLDKAKQVSAAARDDVTSQDRAASGFASPRYKGLVEVAGWWGRSFNQDSQDARDASAAMATSFMASMTGQTEKSLNGGKRAGYARVIRTGSNAQRIQRALQNRLEYWQGIHDTAVEGENGKDAAERKAQARRYLTPCGDAPDVEGGDQITDKNGKVSDRKPKFKGRPSVTINGVAIKYGRGTDRDAQFAAFSELFEAHGDVVLRPDVVDAFLDNGGKFESDKDSSLPGACASVLAGIDTIMSMGGQGSGDHAALMAFHAIVSRIKDEGFKGALVAPVEDSTPEVESAPEAPAQEASEPEDVLAGVGEAPEAPDAPAQEASEPEAGVVLGGTGGVPKRPRRNRGSKEVEVQTGA